MHENSPESKNWTILHILHYISYRPHFQTSQNFTAPIFGNFDGPRFLEVGRTYVPKCLVDYNTQSAETIRCCNRWIGFVKSHLDVYFYIVIP